MVHESKKSTESIQCYICAATFLTETALDWHFKQVHEGENLAKQHGCLLCSETFIESQDLILHMESAHKKSIKNNAAPQSIPPRKKPGFNHHCDLCEKRFV